MPKLTREDWVRLRDGYNVAFTAWPRDAFNALLDTVYGSAGGGNPGSNTAASNKADDTDALMLSLAYIEPPIQPAAHDDIK